MLHPPKPTSDVSGVRDGRHAPKMLAAVLAALVAVLVVFAPVAGATPHQPAHWRGSRSAPILAFAPHRAAIAPLAIGNPFGFGSALAGSAPAGKFPTAVAFDPGTHTIYVADGFGYSGPLAPGDTVSVIDSRHCNARDVSSCTGPWPTITVGNGTAGDEPSGVAVDAASDTVYVSNFGAGTVSVINGATCNAIPVLNFRCPCGRRFA